MTSNESCELRIERKKPYIAIEFLKTSATSILINTRPYFLETSTLGFVVLLHDRNNLKRI